MRSASRQETDASSAPLAALDPWRPAISASSRRWPQALQRGWAPAHRTCGRAGHREVDARSPDRASGAHLGRGSACSLSTTTTCRARSVSPSPRACTPSSRRAGRRAPMTSRSARAPDALAGPGAVDVPRLRQGSRRSGRDSPRLGALRSRGARGLVCRRTECRGSGARRALQCARAGDGSGRPLAASCERAARLGLCRALVAARPDRLPARPGSRGRSPLAPRAGSGTADRQRMDAAASNASSNTTSGSPARCWRSLPGRADWTIELAPDHASRGSPSDLTDCVGVTSSRPPDTIARRTRPDGPGASPVRRSHERCERSTGAAHEQEPSPLVLDQSRQGLGREILPDLRAGLLRLQRGRPVDGLARRRELLARRPERRDVDPVLPAAPGLSPAPFRRPIGTRATGSNTTSSCSSGSSTRSYFHSEYFFDVLGMRYRFTGRYALSRLGAGRSRRVDRAGAVQEGPGRDVSEFVRLLHRLPHDRDRLHAPRPDDDPRLGPAGATLRPGS